MPVTAITHQPQPDSLNAAYQPIVFKIKAKIPNVTAEKYIPPVVYCDVYIDNLYYETFTRTMWINDDGITPEYEFDIQDVLQQVMSYNLPTVDGSKIDRCSNTIKQVYARFRNSYLDDNGFNVSEQKEPQAISNIDEGIKSNTFYVLNSSIQHEENQDLATLLNSYKTGVWNMRTHPLTKKPKSVFLRKTDSSFFPIVSEVIPSYICIEAIYNDGTIHIDCDKIGNVEDLIVNDKS